jgi:hypothetical protein
MLDDGVFQDHVAGMSIDDGTRKRTRLMGRQRTR